MCITATPSLSRGTADAFLQPAQRCSYLKPLGGPLHDGTQPDQLGLLDFVFVRLKPECVKWLVRGPGKGGGLGIQQFHPQHIDLHLCLIWIVLGQREGTWGKRVVLLPLATSTPMQRCGAELLWFVGQPWEQATRKCLQTAWEFGGSWHLRHRRVAACLCVLPPLCPGAFSPAIVIAWRNNHFSLPPRVPIPHCCALFLPLRSTKPVGPDVKDPIPTSNTSFSLLQFSNIFFCQFLIFFFKSAPQSAANWSTVHGVTRASHFHFAWQVSVSLCHRLCSPAAIVTLSILRRVIETTD